MSEFDAKAANSVGGAPVRVRFAPSPTGWLHLGGARTAYFNWLFARQHGGAFVVRSEDTDVQRSSADLEDGVLRDLGWLGLDWDEGPDRGGPYGPYRQSERLEHYQRHADALLGAGRAYRCWCTDQELEERRRAALAAGRPPHYDGRCRRLTPAERAAREASGLPSSVRFEVPHQEVVLDDLVRGAVRFPPGVVGDFVLLRSNGLPTYNFACVVDDSGMAISHVIRAEEHLANTPRQLMLYAALGLAPPAFAHVPLILNRDRTKMSKRAGEASVAVGDWRRDGFVHEAMLSYLALLGFHPGDEREVLSRAELLEAFTLARVGASGSIFDADKLRWTNGHVIHHASGAELRGWIARAERFAAAGGEPWAEAFADPARFAAWPIDRQDRALEIVRGNLETLKDAAAELRTTLMEPPDLDRLEPDAAEALALPGAAEICAALASAVGVVAEWRADTIKSAIQSTGRSLGKKGRELFQPPRVALTGRTHGPELPLLIEFRGKEACVKLLENAANWIRGRSPAA